MSNPESVVVAGPPTDLAELVAVGLAGYEVPSTMSDSEVLIEYLQLLSLEQSSLTIAATYWLQDAIVAYRKGLADKAAALESALTANTTSSSTNTTTSNTTNATTAASALPPKPKLPPLLTPLDRGLKAPILLDSNSSAYPIQRARARSGTAAAEDF